jgi:hypothetical protein
LTPGKKCMQCSDHEHDCIAAVLNSMHSKAILANSYLKNQHHFQSGQIFARFLRLFTFLKWFR